ncbi:junctional adhesion molecule C [Petromyzon marinus]|uniref:junctional adhesion molecule C n=1 Tax=Petromyzon marinus TaxID=7757 RepID=UPI003F6FCC03
MAPRAVLAPLSALLLLLLSQCHRTAAVTVNSRDTNPIVREYEQVTLHCQYQTVSVSPRVEWKKIKGGEKNFVYFNGQITGDLKDRAYIADVARAFNASVTIRNASRSDTATYRCEVLATQDTKAFDEIEINLVVQVKPVTPRCVVPTAVTTGRSTELLCQESEGFPISTYQWFRNGDQVPLDPKGSLKFSNSSYRLNVNTGSLTFSGVRPMDTGNYYCVASNPAGSAQCSAQHMEVNDLNVGAIVAAVIVVVLVVALSGIAIWWAHKMGYFKKHKASSRYRSPPDARGRGSLHSKSRPADDEGDFRHKSSFVI